jgi:hypothetical protein
MLGHHLGWIPPNRRKADDFYCGVIAAGAFTRTQVVDFCLPANEQADFRRD